MECPPVNAQASTLVSQGPRVYRCVESSPTHATLIFPEGERDVALCRVKTITVVHPWHCAFDEWAGLEEEQKAAFICAAIWHKHNVNWAPGVQEKVIRNMAVFDQCVIETAIIVRRGVAHYSCRAMLEIVRHNTFLRMDDQDFKINNNLIPDIARLLMVMFPEIPAGFFELRRNVVKEGNHVQGA